MTHTEAVKLLNEAKDGFNHSRKLINQALFVTGDIREDCDQLRQPSPESCYVRSRQIYGASAYERVFGNVREFRPRRETED
jgi:hypothetical protein